MLSISCLPVDGTIRRPRLLARAVRRATAPERPQEGVRGGWGGKQEPLAGKGCRGLGKEVQAVGPEGRGGVGGRLLVPGGAVGAIRAIRPRRSRLAALPPIRRDQEGPDFEALLAELGLQPVALGL